ncbi:MAG TPA: molybdopterin-dependent oxidoreductase [Polyangiales bacterium]|nr:molybdopterin-dependent oxidoreductase [Polyangiales bacterium]
MPPKPFLPSMSRREVLESLAAGSLVAALGATYVLADDAQTRNARSQRRPDGRPRLPPGQHLIRYLRPMGGAQGDPSPGKLKLRVHGEVDAPYELDFASLLRLPQVDQRCDVHCVTRWTVLDALWRGVRVADLIERAKPKPSARFVIFEAAHGYTSNLPLAEARQPNVLVAHQLEGRPLPIAHGAPLRALVPDLYFWKSAKWLTGIRLSARDQPGYWEVRGYHNHADPWREERDG